MARIIPGVQVTVIKEVVPPQLAPSGVLGLAGLLAPSRGSATRKPVERVGSWARFRELYGRASALAMPEAQQALQNGVFELVVAEVESSVAEAATAAFAFQSDDAWLQVSARAKGTLSNGLEVAITPQVFRGVIQGYELRIRDGGEDLEVHRNLTPFPGDAKYIGKVLDDTDSVVELKKPLFTLGSFGTAETLSTSGATTTVATMGASETIAELVVTLTPGSPTRFLEIVETSDEAGNPILRITRGPITDGTPGTANVELLAITADAPDLVIQVRDALAGQEDLAVELTLPESLPEIRGSKTLAGGVDASVAEYGSALALLEDVADVDMVIASVQDLDVDRAAQVYGLVIAHCEVMSADAKGRLGFGQVPRAGDEGQHGELAGALVSDRFAMFAPHGVLGAAVGRIGSLSYYYSPTFKSLSGLGVIEPALRVEQQRSYLRANIVPVAQLPGRGNAIVRGITTDGDQINVRRIADRAVRGVKQIGELFIGKLNTENGRNALKQKLSEFLLQMQAESAIVPSTDGSDPAFKLDVYSSQADFAKGIVRVDLAVRPVRAIDYIYATVLVQV